MTDAVFDLDAWQAYAETPWAWWRGRRRAARPHAGRWGGASAG